ncbi:DedA family protein, partial [Halobium palmae]
GERDVRWAPNGDGWRLHGLGWANECGLPKWNVYPRCPRGGEATLDSLYFGEGASVASSYVFVYDGTDGVVNVENCYMDQGGVYGVDSRRPPEATGVARFGNCFFRDGYLACLRTGSPDRVAVVEDCVFVYSDDPERTPASDWDDHGNVTGGKRSHRCVWAWWGQVEVRNCAMTNPHGGGIVGGLFAYYAFGEGTNRLVEYVHVDGDPERARAWFRKYGEHSVLWGRLLPFLRSVISIPAGVSGMDLTKFVVYTGVGTFVFNAAVAALVYYGMQQSVYHAVLAYAADHPVAVGVLLLAAAVLGGIVWRTGLWPDVDLGPGDVDDADDVADGDDAD